MKKDPSYIERPPVVVVMGHVDHGKSTLLDYIRKSNTVGKEAGGITQHVAAYEVEHASKNGLKKRITFIDTPGHAAFSAIRARGANVADIAILVVAADDGVKAQTLEALGSIRGAGIPYIIAINKIDKPNANIERTQASLLEQNVYLEKFGGDVPWVSISAKTGVGVEELLDLILIVAELQEFRADASAPAHGYVIEAHRDQRRGIAATLILTNGTLKSGMAILAGRAIAPVRIMENHAGKSLKTAIFSTPVTLVGFDELPDVGEKFSAFATKKLAEEARAALPQKEIIGTIQSEGERYIMPIIVRADASGSLEAIAHEIARLGDEHSGVAIAQSGVGNVGETDVKAAVGSATPAIIIGFNVGIDAIAQEYARQHNVRIELFNIIYKLTERLEALLEEARPARVVEKIVGRAKVLKQFSSRKVEHVVGGKVTEGYLARGGSLHVMRRGILVGEGRITNMQSHRQNVDRVETESEFGAQIEAPFEIAQGDTLECFTTEEK